MKPTADPNKPSIPTEPSNRKQFPLKPQVGATPGRDQVRQTVPVRAARESKRPIERSK